MAKQNKQKNNMKKNMKKSIKDYNEESLIHKLIKNMRLISLGLIIVFVLYVIFNKLGLINITWPSFFFGNGNDNGSNRNGNYLEGFSNPELGNFFGNCLFTTDDISENDKDIKFKLSQEKPYVDIDLPNESKLLGFKVESELSSDNNTISLNTTTTDNLKSKINHHKEDTIVRVNNTYEVTQIKNAINFIEKEINDRIENYKTYNVSQLPTTTVAATTNAANTTTNTTTKSIVNILKNTYNNKNTLDNELSRTLNKIKDFMNNEYKSLVTGNIISDEINQEIKTQLLSNIKANNTTEITKLLDTILDKPYNFPSEEIPEFITDINENSIIENLIDNNTIGNVNTFASIFKLSNDMVNNNITGIDFTTTVRGKDVSILYFKLDKSLVVNNTKYNTVSNGTENIYYVNANSTHNLYIKTDNTSLNKLIIDDLIFNIEHNKSILNSDIYKLNNNWTRYTIKSINTLSFTELKYSLEIGTNNNDLKPVINSANYNKFSFGDSVIDTALFENEDGTPKYVGTKVRVSIKNIDTYKETMSDTQEIPIEIRLFGLDVYAPDYKEYTDNYTAKTTADTDDIDSYSSDNDNNVLTLKSGENRKVIAVFIPKTVSSLLKVKYSNTYDNNTRKYVVRGPIQEGFNITDNNIIYFNKPIIANKIYFNTNISSSDNGSDIKVYLARVGKRDEINFKLKTGVDDAKTQGLDVEGEKCPNTQQMIQKQLQAQQICEALEYKDRIKNAKVVYEKEKEYLKKLARQEKELKDLEAMINKIIARKNKRISENQYYNVEQLDRELRQIEESRKKAEQELLETKKAHDIKVDLQLDPQYTDILKKYEETGLL
jgi:hypothetical protein